VTDRKWIKSGGWICGWLLIAWAALRAPNGAAAFVLILIIFLIAHVLLPGVRQLWHLPKTSPVPPAAPESGAAPAGVVALLVGLLWLGASSASSAYAADSAPRPAVRPTQEPASTRLTEDPAIRDTGRPWLSPIP